MDLLVSMERFGHEQVIFCHDKNSSLHAIIAIHDTTRGSALGGCRLWNYEKQEDALRDVLRLSRGMTYKSALANLPLGGGKTVIIADPNSSNKSQLMRAFGRFVNSLHGKYITSQDVGVENKDLLEIRRETKYVVGLPVEEGGTGDPSPITALGVLWGIKASVFHKLGKDNLQGVRVAVQGCGNVGACLSHLLHAEGAQLYVSDINTERANAVAEKCKAKVVNNEEITSLAVDVFSPCAMGAVLNDNTIAQLQAKIIAGGANNQLADEVEHDLLLHKKGILYAPDYVVNAGGLMSVSYEVVGIKHTKDVEAKTKDIYHILLEIYRTAEKQGEGTGKTANKLAEKHIADHANLKKINTAC